MEAKRKKLEEEARKKRNEEQRRMNKETAKLGTRQMCHCQGLVHQLVSNCTGCGRIICEQEGEGDCLFCKQKGYANVYVESWKLVDQSENKSLDPAYAQAVQKRNRLLDFDKGGVTHSSIKDQGADWYELENNTWESKENRVIAKKMREIEEQNKEMEESALYVSIGGGKDDDFVSLKAGVVKSNEEIAKEANDYINQLAMDNLERNQQFEDEEQIFEDFKDIRITSCSVMDQRAKELIDKCREDALRAEEEMIENSKKIKAKAENQGILESLSERLQSENPFDDFKKHLDQALKEQEADKEKDSKKEGENKSDDGHDPKFLKMD